MPIKGLTDRQEGAFPQIGVIRKGAPKTQNAPGKELTYWRVEFDSKEEQAQKDFISKFGPQPTDIVIVLPFNEIDRCWESWKETYIAGALIHRCDGEFVRYAINPSTGEKLVINGVGQDGRPVRCRGKADGCKPVGRLRVIVPELKRLAYMLVLTTSINDCKNISDQLTGIAQMNAGRLAGIPLVLRRRPRKISTPSGEGGKRARREKWLISIEADPEWVRAKLAKMYHDALPGNGLDEIKGISAPAHIEADSGPKFTEELDDDDDDGYGDETSVDYDGANPASAKTMTDLPALPSDNEPLPTTLAEAYNQGAKDGKAMANRPAQWSPQVITWAVQKWNLKSQQVVGALNKSCMVKPDDADTVLQEWLTNYRAAREATDSDASAETADIMRKSALAENTIEQTA